MRDLTWKERLGLYLLQWGARLYFTFSKNSGKYPDYDKDKMTRLIDEINGDLLEAHTCHAGGHGYCDSELANNNWVGTSIILVLKNALRLADEPSTWVEQARRYSKVQTGSGGQPGGPGGPGYGPSGADCSLANETTLKKLAGTPKKKKKKKDKDKKKSKKKKDKKS